MGEKWETPFTQAQVEAIRRHQADVTAPPYTCPTHGGPLAVSWDGLECPISGCWYHQHWSHGHA